MTATGIAVTTEEDLTAVTTEEDLIAVTTEEDMAATAATAAIDMETEGTEVTTGAMVTTDGMIAMTGTVGIEGRQVRGTLVYMCSAP